MLAIVTAQSNLSAVTIASELLLREPVRMLKGHFSILKIY
jgi:hypothetical protein